MSNPTLLSFLRSNKAGIANSWRDLKTVGSSEAKSVKTHLILHEKDANLALF